MLDLEYTQTSQRFRRLSIFIEIYGATARARRGPRGASLGKHSMRAMLSLVVSVSMAGLGAAPRSDKGAVFGADSVGGASPAAEPTVFGAWWAHVPLKNSNSLASSDPDVRCGERCKTSDLPIFSNPSHIVSTPSLESQFQNHRLLAHGM